MARAKFAALLLALAVGAAACGDDGSSDAGVSTTTSLVGAEATPFDPDAELAPTVTVTDLQGIGLMTVELIDASRSTPANHDLPRLDRRRLETLVWYPASDGEPGEVVVGAAPDSSGGPLPLIVFSHGVRGRPEQGEALIRALVSEGFVVVAPAFPLTKADAPAGVDLVDLGSQPGDVSYLISEIVDDPGVIGLGPAMIDGDRIGAVGHSAGAATTLAATAHTCCRDERIGVAAILAPSTPPFSGGDYEWRVAPPVLVVHGTEDNTAPYNGAVALFNDLPAPKAFLSIAGGDHDSWLGGSGPAHDDVAQAVVDFLLVHLEDSASAAERLHREPRAEGTILYVVESGVDDTPSIPTTTIAGVDRRAMAEPTTGLIDGDVVTVTWSGYTPGGNVNVVQCASGGAEGPEFCDLGAAHILLANPTGSGSVDLAVTSGAVGQGICGPDVDDCVIAVEDFGVPDAAGTILLPLDFAS